MLYLRTLGTIDLTGSNGHGFAPVITQPKRLALLAYLAVARPRGFHRRDTLLALFWPESDEPRARAALSRAVYYLRSALGDDVILGRGDQELGLSDERITSDVAVFDRALQAGRTEDALSLYGGDLLEGLIVTGVPGFERWVESERESLRSVARRAAVELTSACEQAADLDRAVHWARRSLDLAPFDESLARRLMSLLDRSGNRAGAIQVFEAFVEQLDSELEIEPSPETLQLLATIRARTDANGSSRGPEEQASGKPQRPTAVAPTAGAGTRLDVDPGSPISGARKDVPGRSLRRRLLETAPVALILLAVAWYALGRSPESGAVPPDRSISSLAVQPVRVIGDEPTIGLYSDGLTEDLTTRLSQLRSLRVVSRLSSSRAAGPDTSPVQLGRQLGVDAVVSGTVQREGDGVRTTARLVDARTGDVLWSHSYDSEVEDLLDVQRDIAMSVAGAVNAAVSERERERLQARSSVDLTAWEYAERASMLVQVEEVWTPETEARALDLLNKALALEPDYSPAHAALGLVYRRRVWLPHDHPARYDSARAAANRAISLDPDHFLSHHALGLVLVSAARPEVTDSIQQFQARGLEALLRAAELNPSYSPTLFLLGGPSGGRIRFGHHILWQERAYRINQDWIEAYEARGWTYWMLGDFGRAVRAYRSALELEPDNLHHRMRLVQIYLAQGRLELARQEIGAVRAADPEFVDILPEAFVLAVREGDLTEAEALARRALERTTRHPLLGDHPVLALSLFFPETGLAYVLLRTDRESAARQILEALDRDLTAFVERGGCCTYELARVHALMGDTETALEWIERAVGRGWWFYHHMGPLDPMLESIRDEPRFVTAMERVREALEAERAFVEEVEVLSESEQFERLLADERSLLEELRGEA